MIHFFHKMLKSTVIFLWIMITNHYSQITMPHNMPQITKKVNLFLNKAISKIMNLIKFMKQMKKVQTIVKVPVQTKSKYLMKSKKLSLRMRQGAREVLHLHRMLNIISPYLRRTWLMIRNQICLDLASHAQERKLMLSIRLSLKTLWTGLQEKMKIVKIQIKR